MANSVIARALPRDTLPWFSVIIPVYNRYDLVCRAIDSVLSQSYQNFRCHVIDDGSTDSTQMIGERYGEAIDFATQNHGGVSRARNNGIRRSRYPWIAFLDSDDLWLPEKLASDYNFIVTNPGYRIFQCDERWFRNGRHMNKKKRHLRIDENLFEQSLELCLISPSAVVMHRSLFDEFGTFNENLPACEDYAYWLPVTACEKIGFIPQELIVKHGGHEDQLSVKFSAMDRFRLYSLCLFFEGYRDYLTIGQQALTVKAIKKKGTILAAGSRKRGSQDLSLLIEALIEDPASRRYSHKEIQFLLQQDAFP